MTRISTAKLSPQSSQPDLKILAIANPRPTKTDLPGTEQQANYITQNFPNSQQYSREQATLTTFKNNSPKFPILHLGTHGCFQRQGFPTLNMEANTLLFANGEKYNIADAALLGLKDTQLIVFSACQTAKEIDENDQSLPGLAGNVLDLWIVFSECSQSTHYDLSYPQIQNTTTFVTLAITPL